MPDTPKAMYKRISSYNREELRRRHNTELIHIIINIKHELFFENGPSWYSEVRRLFRRMKRAEVKKFLIEKTKDHPLTLKPKSKEGNKTHYWHYDERYHSEAFSLLTLHTYPFMKN